MFAPVLPKFSYSGSCRFPHLLKTHPTWAVFKNARYFRPEDKGGVTFHSFRYAIPFDQIKAVANQSKHAHRNLSLTFLSGNQRNNCPYLIGSASSSPISPNLGFSKEAQRACTRPLGDSRPSLTSSSTTSGGKKRYQDFSPLERDSFTLFFLLIVRICSKPKLNHVTMMDSNSAC